MTMLIYVIPVMQISLTLQRMSRHRGDQRVEKPSFKPQTNQGARTFQNTCKEDSAVHEAKETSTESEAYAQKVHSWIIEDEQYSFAL